MTRQQDKPKLLVTGASGFLGSIVCAMAARSWEVFGTMCHHPVTLPGVHMCRIDLTDEHSVIDLFTSIGPDAVVHAAALSSPDHCQEHPAESEAVNVVASTYIASMCAEHAIPCAFTSSDLVFDGEHAPYREESPPSPISVYGEHKLRAEEAMRSCYPNITICRLPLMFGDGGPAADGSFKWMLRSMQKGAKVPLFVDEIRTPVSTETAAEGLTLALQKARGMTLHLGGSENISRWNLGQVAAEVFFSGNAFLVPCQRGDVALPAPRPRDVSLDSTRARDMGYRPKTIREQMERLRTTMRGLGDV